MKKLILVLTSILFFIYVFFSLISLKDGYRAERGLWRLDHTLNYIASHNESTPDYTVDQLANRYRAFISKYHGTIFSHQAELMLGNLYLVRKNYTQAREEYQKAICSDKELSAQAEFAIGKVYELEGNWDQAMSTYEGIIQNYPITSTGFMTPMYLTKYTDRSYSQALAFYRKIAAEYPKSKYEFDALKMISICQLKQQDWSGTVQTMAELLIKYPIGNTIKESVEAINRLCVIKLHNYDMAINIYQQFIHKYPTHPANKALIKMIKALQVLKNKDLIIKTKK